MAYQKRICDDELSNKLKSHGAVLIEGVRGCGKTETAIQRAKSSFFLDSPATSGRDRQLLSIDPRQLLKGSSPRLVDEWKELPELWDVVCEELRRPPGIGQFILTSSTAAGGNKVAKLPDGFARIRMRPMSLMESGDSSGEVSLAWLSTGGEMSGARCDTGLDQVAYWCCRGGWPQALEGSQRAQLQYPLDYVETLAESDLAHLDKARISPDIACGVLRAFAQASGTQTSLAHIAAAVRDDVGKGSDLTVSRYADALRGLYIVDNLTAWKPMLRSRTPVRTSGACHLADPSLAAAALGIGPDMLVSSLDTLGKLFKSLCVRDLRVYARALGGRVCHYRDKRGLECDAVVRLNRYSFGLVQARLGGAALIEEAAQSLLRLSSDIDEAKTGKPAFLMVLTGVGEQSYKRDDGVLVVPVATLGV